MKKYCSILLLCIALAACNKVKLDAPQFTVSTPKSTYKVGDTVTFNFTGNPDNIVFYSGEVGARYANRTRVSATGGQAVLQFSTTVAGGNQTGNLSLMASNNFSGVFTTTDIHNATWTDITSRATLATSATAVTSGPINITDLASAGKPLYIGFRYLSPTNTAASIGRGWTVTPLVINTSFPDGTKNALAADIATGGFAPVSIIGDSLKWIVSTSLKFNTGYVGNADEDWAISKGLDLSAVSPDAGVPIKNMSTKLTSIPYYIYQTAGTYTVSFAVSNGNIDKTITDVKEVTITITP